MTQSVLPLAAILLLLPSIASAAQPLDTFAERRQWIIDTVTANPEAWIKANKQIDNPFFAASACFSKGMDDKGRELARAGYRFWTANPKPNFDPKSPDDRTKMRVVDFFRLWPAMDCYVRNKSKLDEPSKAAFKNYMTSINFYAYGATANLNMMMWTARHLGEQEWGADAFVPLAPDPRARHKSTIGFPFRERLLAQLTDIARTGGPEYASRPYGAANLAPILTLAQLSKDPEIRRRARVAHESILAHYAAVWLQGSLIISSRRSYPDSFNDPEGITSYLWTFLGGNLISESTFKKPRSPEFNILGPCLDAAVLGDDVPAIVQHIASDRRQPYEARNRFEPMSSCRQISWVDADYGVFSESFHTKPKPFNQTYPFGVRWIVPGSTHHTILWFSVPALDAGPQHISHPHGFNLDAQSTFQYQGTILFVVNTKNADKPVAYPYGLCYVPGGALAVIDESKGGRVFLHYPGVLIALNSTKPFTWNRTATMRMPNVSVPADPADTEFRIDGPTFAAAIETAPARKVPAESPAASLALFRESIVAKSKVELLPGERIIGRYTTRSNAVIQREFAGAAMIDGQPVDFDGWPVASSKWSKQATHNSHLVVSDGNATREYDFTHWIIADGKAK